MSVRDKGRFKGRARIDRFTDPDGKIAEFLRGGGSIEEAIKRFGKYLGKVEFGWNLLLNEGIGELWDLACGLGTPTAFDSTNARVGVGDDTTPASADQTALLGVNQLYVGMDTGYPTRTAQTVDWRGTFDGTQANWAWQEFSVDNGSVALINLNRLVSDQGTKVSGQTWVLTISITLS